MALRLLRRRMDGQTSWLSGLMSVLLWAIGLERGLGLPCHSTCRSINFAFFWHHDLVCFQGLLELCKWHKLLSYKLVCSVRIVSMHTWVFKKHFLHCCPVKEIITKTLRIWRILLIVCISFSTHSWQLIHSTNVITRCACVDLRWQRSSERRFSSRSGEARLSQSLQSAAWGSQVVWRGEFNRRLVKDGYDADSQAAT